MTRLRNFRKPAACIVAAWLAGCGRYEWQGPTDVFRGLDANADGDVDRFEWENLHGAEYPTTLGFRYSDCDLDGRLSWHEYFVGYMKLAHCPGPYLYEPQFPASDDDNMVAAVTQEDDALGEDWREGPLLARADENVQIYTQDPEGPDVPTVLQGKRPPRAARHSEQDLPPAAFQLLGFTTIPLKDTLLVAHYDVSEKIPGNEARGVYPRMSCEIANENGDYRITLTDVQVVWRVSGREYRSRWLKTLWIDPGTTQSLDVWFSSAVDSADCRLLHARGQAVRR